MKKLNFGDVVSAVGQHPVIYQALSPLAAVTNFQHSLYNLFFNPSQLVNSLVGTARGVGFFVRELAQPTLYGDYITKHISPGLVSKASSIMEPIGGVLALKGGYEILRSLYDGNGDPIQGTIDFLHAAVLSGKYAIESIAFYPLIIGGEILAKGIYNVYTSHPHMLTTDENTHNSGSNVAGGDSLELTVDYGM